MEKLKQFDNSRAEDEDFNSKMKDVLSALDSLEEGKKNQIKEEVIGLIRKYKFSTDQEKTDALKRLEEIFSKAIYEISSETRMGEKEREDIAEGLFNEVFRDITEAEQNRRMDELE